MRPLTLPHFTSQRNAVFMEIDGNQLVVNQCICNQIQTPCDITNQLSVLIYKFVQGCHLAENWHPPIAVILHSVQE